MTKLTYTGYTESDSVPSVINKNENVLSGSSNVELEEIRVKYKRDPRSDSDIPLITATITAEGDLSELESLARDMEEKALEMRLAESEKDVDVRIG